MNYNNYFDKFVYKYIIKMKNYEFLRLIQEIGIILNHSAPTISHVITIYKRSFANNIQIYVN